MRPSKSTKDMELKSLKKNIKVKDLLQDVQEKSLKEVQINWAGNLKASYHDPAGNGSIRRYNSV